MGIGPWRQGTPALRIEKRRRATAVTKEEIRDVFESIAVTRRDFKGRVIDEDGMRAALRKVNLPCSDDMVEELLYQYDRNHDECIDLAEFERYVRGKEKQIAKAFRKLDVDRSGKVTATELRQGLRNMGIPATQRDVSSMVSLLDRNRDNAVDIDEFRRYAVLLPAAQMRANVGWPWLESALEELTAVAPSGEPLKALMVGGLAGALARTMVAPLERVRSALMVSGGKQGAQTALVSKLRAIVAAEGVAGLFRGNTAGVIKMFPRKAIEFAVYDEVKTMLARRKARRSSKTSTTLTETNDVRFLAGAAAGATSQLLLHPLDVAKLRQSIGVQGNPFQILTKIAKTEKLEGLYSGLGPKLTDTVLATGLGFLSYDFGKAVFRRSCHRRPRPFESAIIGAASSCLSISLLLPLQVVTKRLMAQGQPGVAPYTGAIDAFVTIAKLEGTQAFFRGAKLTYMKMIPQIAMTFLIYESLGKRWALGGLKRYRAN